MPLPPKLFSSCWSHCLSMTYYRCWNDRQPQPTPPFPTTYKCNILLAAKCPPALLLMAPSSYRPPACPVQTTCSMYSTLRAQRKHEAPHAPSAIVPSTGPAACAKERVVCSPTPQAPHAPQRPPAPLFIDSCSPAPTCSHPPHPASSRVVPVSFLWPCVHRAGRLDDRVSRATSVICAFMLALAKGETAVNIEGFVCFQHALLRRGFCRSKHCF